MNSRSRMPLKTLVVIFRALETSTASLTSAASATSLDSTTSTSLFPQKTFWSWWFDHLWHQKDQYQTFCMWWIIKNPNFYWCMVPMLLEAVEASICHFFKKLVNETQISKPQEYTDTFKQNLSCLFLSVRGILKETFQCETLCIYLPTSHEYTFSSLRFVKLISSL